MHFPIALCTKVCYENFVFKKMTYIHTHKATVLCDVIMFPVCTSYFEVFLYEHASSHCTLLWYANTLFTNKITLCCGFLSLYQAWCVSVFLFLSYMNMLVPIVLVVDTKGCLQTMGML